MTQENFTKFFDGLYEAPKYQVIPGVSGRYAVSEGDGIYEDVKNKMIIFPVVGYTKTVDCHPGINELSCGSLLQRFKGKNRQMVIRELMDALHIQPLTPQRRIALAESAKIKLIKEPKNPYDAHCILIIAETAEGQSFPIGHVPAKINKLVTAKNSWFEEANIMLVFRLDDNDKHIKPQLVTLYESPHPEKNRFSNIQYD